jgi:hypothetical protein
LFGCRYDVINKEPVFDNFKPESKEYKNKLAEKINNNPDDIAYYLKDYHLINDKEYLEFDVEGTDFKGTGLVLVKDWQKMQLIRKNKGNGYCGAEFSLQLNVIPNPEGAVLIYKDLNWIID